ncbi:MAG: tRNA (N(6)-L-threonylcarbamoyladenosine(37)-C(2))-methylthiotransferase MtaB [Holosporales bacterium]|jgi:threonylcarbamoyladenosine tRNA methylthiotransferase MtaB|nr:tRNA (N(6)-L-threonylcarbamoyladenosine(37)-C(2))-methylthiotransferase MtaB [Holosporales bacterium]
MSTRNIKVITLGCRFNSYESEVTKSIISDLQPDSDVVVINTCAVTHEAERQSKQAVRKAIRENKDAKIIITGCATKTDMAYFDNLDGVFKVISNEKKGDPDEYFDIPHEAVKPETGNILFEDKVRAFVQIQNGCNHFCSYCIVPFTRGRSRSLPIADILAKVENISKNQDVKELVLSGIDISSYGQDIRDIELADAVESVLTAYPQMRRLRLSSLDPAQISDRLLDLLVSESRIMPHFHLSIQSGDDVVLKAMRRRHTRDDVIGLCNRIRARRENVIFGCDFIAGFPVETDEMFQNTLKLIDEAKLSLMHVFPYSSRAGTAAASMIQLPRSVVLERAKILREKATQAKHGLFLSLIGTKTSVIIESISGEYSYGKTDTFIPVKISNTKLQCGNIVDDAIVVGFDGGILEAQLTKN